MTRQASAKYYQKDNEKIFKSVLKGIKILQKKKRNKKGEYGLECCKNLSEDEKQKLVEHRKRYYEIQKITERTFNKVPVSCYRSKNGTVLRWSRLRFLAKRVGEIGAILGKSEAFETKQVQLQWNPSI